MVESLLLDNVEKFRGKSVEYSKVPLNVAIIDEDDQYPVQVELQSTEASMSVKVGEAHERRSHLDHGPRKKRRILAQKHHHSGSVVTRIKNSHPETIRAKCVVGCDGAHSWTRKHFGIPFRGQRTHDVWGVMDVIPLTNFPDTRKNCMIESDHGNLLLIPRENKLARLYVELPENDTKTDWMTVKMPQLRAAILKRAQSILSPYHFTYKYCDWSSCYGIGQRLADNFSV
ncbi:MAG: hypothetical protein Q9198_000010 [Flavoplaca austrocitrina]